MNIGANIEAGDLLKIKEAALIATVKPSTIASWLCNGKLPRVKVGRLTRIWRQDLNAFLRAGHVPKVSEQ